MAKIAKGGAIDLIDLIALIGLIGLIALRSGGRGEGGAQIYPHPHPLSTRPIRIPGVSNDRKITNQIKIWIHHEIP